MTFTPVGKLQSCTGLTELTTTADHELDADLIEAGRVEGGRRSNRLYDSSLYLPMGPQDADGLASIGVRCESNLRCRAS